MTKKVFNNNVIGAFLGTIVEYYDYTLYGFSANIIAAKFFPASDGLTNLINAFAIYGIAYFSKPIGSLIFGYIGDHYGRKLSLNITIIGMVIPTMIIGMLPDYSTLGGWSTLILAGCRLLQGIFVGGEYDGAAIFVIEHLGKKRRFMASCLTRSTGAIGLLLGISATNFFNAHIFPQWGWRIPFLLSLPFSLITLYYRTKFEETPDFKQTQNQIITKTSVASMINRQWATIGTIALLAGSAGVTYQIGIIFMKQYLPLVLPPTSFIISIFSILLVLCFGISMPIAGWLADNFSPFKIIKFSALGTIISTILIAIAISYQMTNLALASCLLLAAFIAPFNGLGHGIFITAFPIYQRFQGISLGHAIGSTLMSGTANYVCLMGMRSLNLPLFPLIYLSSFAFLGYLIYKLFNNKYKTISTKNR